MKTRRSWQILTLTLFLSSFAAFALGKTGFAPKPEERGAVEQQQPVNPCNPCAKKKAQNPCNPCANKAQNPCNPCAAKKASEEVYAPATSYSHWTKINSKPLLSEAHGGLFVTTFANPTAQEAIRSKARSFPVGSILIKESHANTSGKPGEKGTIFGMEKTANGWLWVTTDARGHVTGKGDSTQMQMCAQCHAGAQVDSAFLRKE
ncbi:MAG TPA: cytochrome P460 family protein [Blastocatellia bacterium]|nr:cytochrome P460 family protein [Blastocatellia bacterium]